MVPAIFAEGFRQTAVPVTAMQRIPTLRFPESHPAFRIHNRFTLTRRRRRPVQPEQPAALLDDPKGRIHGVHITGHRPVNKCATAREGKAIRLGMTLGQVRNTIGSRGYLDVRGAVTVRSWLGCGPDLTVGFVGGRVASIVY